MIDLRLSCCNSFAYNSNSCLLTQLKSTILLAVQIQMRDIPGFVDTRQQLLQLKPNAKGHWLGFAVAHHLNGNHALAVQILESYQDTQDSDTAENEQYELSELLMYKAMVLREGGHQLKALELLQSQKVMTPFLHPDPQILQRLTVLTLLKAPQMPYRCTATRIFSDVEGVSCCCTGR